ncbi:hypothetical protein Zmor_020108 [Zophobas morio]|uniref:Uncharacterized protein n=1 Tax=Zophobas morio TaxID=2755281 RepID=A0AA38I248_9CUCU|nr:hypothetical protein Zmor_020108 [Zophobas morio]
MVATCVASSNIQIPFLLHLCCAVSGEKKLRYHQLCSLLEHRVNTEWSPAPPHLAPFLPRLGRTSMESHPSLCRFFRNSVKSSSSVLLPVERAPFMQINKALLEYERNGRVA